LYIISFSCLHGISLACHTQFLVQGTDSMFLNTRLLLPQGMKN
jgi:hypothetical protein